jgi:hypothetical protein
MGCYGLMSVKLNCEGRVTSIPRAIYGREPLRVATELDDSVMVRLE